MTAREKEILDLIKKNPMISQQEIANILNITRSSVAVHITNLMKKGYIRGKGYILNENEYEYVLVIGGANIDIQGFANKSLMLCDSNPGKIKMSLGGVGRNIADNLTRLGVHTKLIAPIGDDIYGSKIIDDCRHIGIDMEHSIVFKGVNSSVYLSVINDNGNMEVAISDMDILNLLTVDMLKEKSHIIQNAKVVAVDTNISEELLYYLVKTYKNVDFFLDTVSTAKAVKVKEFIGDFHTIKPNLMEAEILSGITVKNETDLRRAADFFLQKGVKNVFISMGDKGVFYTDGEKYGHFRTPKRQLVNATGAGDAFIAALIYSHINDYDIEHSAAFGAAAAIIAISHEDTINPMMSVESIEKTLKEIREYVY